MNGGVQVGNSKSEEKMVLPVYQTSLSSLIYIVKVHFNSREIINRNNNIDMNSNDNGIT